MAGHTLSYMATLNSSGFMTGLNQMLSGLSGFSGSLNGLKSALGGLGKLLTNPFVLGAAAITGVGLAVGKAVGNFVSFDDQMRKVAAVTRTAMEDMGSLTDKARELGATTKFTGEEVGQGMQYLGMAGFSKEEIEGSIGATLNLAQATGTGLGETADIMSNIMSTFKMGAEESTHAADVMALTTASSNTDLLQLGDSMKYVGPVAQSMGMSFEEAAAATGFLSNVGIQGSMAGTTLRGALSRLSDAAPKEVFDILEKYGLSMEQVSAESHDFTDILQTLHDAGMSTGDMLQLMGLRAGPGMLELISQGKDPLNEYIESLKNADGTAQTMADTMEGGLGGAIRSFKSRIASLSQGQFISDIANNIVAPLIRGVTSGIGTIQNLFGNIYKGVKTSDLAASIGKMFSGVSKYISASTGNLSKLFDPIKQSIEKVFGEGAIGKGIGALFNNLTNGAEAAFEIIGKGFELLASGAEALGPVFETVGKTIGSAIEVIGPKIQQAKTFVEAFANVLKEKIANSETVQKIKETFNNVADSVKNGLETAKTYLNNFVSDVKSWVNDIIDHVKEFVSSLGIIDKIKEKLGLDTEGSFFSDVMKEFERLKFEDATESLVDAAKDAGESLGDTAKDGIIDAGTEAGQAMANEFEWALSNASGFMRGMEPIYENGNLVRWQSVKEKENVNVPWKEYTNPGISVKADTKDYAGLWRKSSPKWTQIGSKWATTGTISLESPGIFGIQTFEDYVQALQDYGYTLEEIGILTRSVNKEKWTPIDVPEGASHLRNIRETVDGFEVLSKSNFAGAFGKDVSEFLESNKEFAEGYYSDESVSDMLARKTRAEELLWEEAEFTRWASSMPMDIQNASEEIQKALYDLYAGKEIAGSTAREGGIFQNFLGLDQDSLDDSTKDIIKNVESAWNKIIQYADDSIISQEDWNMLQSYFDLLESKGIDVTEIKSLFSEKIDEIIGGMDKYIKSQMESLGSDVMQYYEDGLLKSEAQDIYDRALGLDKLRVENPQLWAEIGNADMDAFINELIAAEGDVAKIAEITGRYYGEHFNVDIFGNVEPEQLIFNFAENWEENVKKMKDDVTDWNLFRENVALPALKQSLEHEKQLLSTASGENYKVVNEYVNDLIKLYGEMPEAFGKAEVELINSLSSAYNRGAPARSLIDLIDKYLGTEKATKDLADSTKNLYNEYNNLDECISSTFSTWRNQQPDMFYESIVGSTENYIKRVKELAELGRASDTQIEYAASLNGQSVDEFLGKTAELENAANIEAMLESDQALTDAGNLESDISAMVPEMEVSLLTTNALLDAQSLFASIERMNPHMQVSVDVSANAGQIADIAQAAVRDAIASAYSG